MKEKLSRFVSEAKRLKGELVREAAVRRQLARAFDVFSNALSEGLSGEAMVGEPWRKWFQDSFYLDFTIDSTGRVKVEMKVVDKEATPERLVEFLDMVAGELAKEASRASEDADRLERLKDVVSMLAVFAKTVVGG